MSVRLRPRKLCSAGPMFHLRRTCRPRNVASLASTASEPTHAAQIYVSQSTSPLTNLAVEHHLLQHSHPSSTLLFLYANRPCVVLGTNQNPWLEVNLPLLREHNAAVAEAAARGAPVLGSGEIRLVRRRSGGGTVFHDEGNVNYCVICPPDRFNRDKHAEMVTRALRTLGVSTAHVNVRHDIVIVPPPAATAATTPPPPTLKVSGSAFKLTRLRALHHGTCLLSSPNLSFIGRVLRSPGAPFMRTRGVESVRSRVANLGVDRADWEREVVREFEIMYGPAAVREVVDGDGDGALAGEVRAGKEELMSPRWIYGRSPRFTFSTHPTRDDDRPRPESPFKSKFEFESRHGIIDKASLGTETIRFPGREPPSIWGAASWKSLLRQASGISAAEADALGGWMDRTLGTSLQT